MGCFSRSGERRAVSEQQKWDYINLSDFKSHSCLTFLSYAWLWILILICISVYAADTFTAYKLLKFDKWTNGVDPAIPYKPAKYIFIGCIAASWLLAIYAWIRALRVMRRNSVTEDYLDPLAIELQSIRFGSGWRRFLVFAELTKSKKKVTWVALFVYFQRKEVIRLLAADGPRQVINALTLWGVAKSKLLTQNGKQAGIGQFFSNLKTLFDKDRERAIVISTMTFTLVIWAVFMLFLILALILYIAFLWHYIQDATLAGFCRKKVETRLARIVKAKTDKIWAKQQERYEKAARKNPSNVNLESGAVPPKIGRQPTLPALDSSPPSKTAGIEFSRADSNATLPLYSSDSKPPPFHRQPTLPSLVEDGRPGPPSRTGTGYSDASFSSDAPLLSQSAGMGYSNLPANRSMTPGSNRSFTPMSAQGGRGGPPLPPLATNGQQGSLRFPPPSRTNTGFSQQSRASPLSAGTQNYTPISAQSNRITPTTPYDQRQGPSYEMTPVEQRGYAGQDYFSQNNSGRNSPGPTRFPQNSSGRISPGPASFSQNNGRNSPGPSQLPPSLQMPRRDMSAPMPPRGPAPNGQLPWLPNRSATAPVPDYARGGGTERSHTAGPVPRVPMPDYGRGPTERSHTAGPQERGGW